MDLIVLRHFIAVAQLGSFTRAAESMHASQSVITRSVQRLEEHLETKLIERTTRRLSLTPAGTAFLDEAVKIVKRLSFASNNARLIGQGETTSLRIAVCPTTGAPWLPHAIRNFQAKWPSVQISLVGILSGVQTEALRAGEVDVGIMVLPAPLKDDLNYQKLMRAPMVVAAPSSWGFGHGSHIALSELADRPWVMPERRGASYVYDRFVDLFRQAGFDPIIRGKVLDLVNARLMVACGVGALFYFDWGDGHRPPDIDLLAFDDIESPTSLYAVVAWPAKVHSHQINDLVQCLLAEVRP